MRTRPLVFGNTTIRNPWRIPEALTVLSASPSALPKNGREHENTFAKFLADKGIVTILRHDADVSDLGRKWRSGLVKLGFLYPMSHELSFSLTPSGQRMAEANSLSARQENFLRALAGVMLPSSIEPLHKCAPYFPFRFILAIALKMEALTEESSISFTEMACIVQFRDSSASVAEVCKEILQYRKQKASAQAKRKFDSEFMQKSAVLYGYNPGTLGDYADTNFRYLKATGVFCASGRGIKLVAHKRFVAKAFATNYTTDMSRDEHIGYLADGAALPTDNEQVAWDEWSFLLSQLKTAGIKHEINVARVDGVAAIKNACHEADMMLTALRESQYAERQRTEWQEIADIMMLLAEKKVRRKNAAETSISIPDSERAAYMEWVLWRAFLAIDSLVNKPFEARRFHVDVDFLPVSTAPGGGPDMWFEFENFHLVVEVTLTEGSRQEAWEGEPVRRHVSDYVERSRGKPVYGLFVAPKIDTNTAETFRAGVWYNTNDVRVNLQIVPVRLKDFATFFHKGFSDRQLNPQDVKNLLDECRRLSQGTSAPVWKNQIKKLILA